MIILNATNIKKYLQIIQKFFKSLSECSLNMLFILGHGTITYNTNWRNDFQSTITIDAIYNHYGHWFVPIIVDFDFR